MAGTLTQNLVLQKTKLNELRHVRKLNVCNSQLCNVQILRETPNLEVLSLSVNDIADLEALGACYNLRELYLRKNVVADRHQVLHLARLPQLASLTLSDNPMCDDDYRRFVIAALPALVRLDDIDITPHERREAEARFPGISRLPPPGPAAVAAPAAQQGSGAFAPQLQSSPARPPSASGGAQTPRGSLPLRAPSSGSLAQRLADMTSAFDELPVGGRRSSAAVLKQQQRHGGFEAAAAAAPPPLHHSRASPIALGAPAAAGGFNAAGGPSEAGVAQAIKLLLLELSPASLVEMRQHIDALLH